MIREYIGIQLKECSEGLEHCVSEEKRLAGDIESMKMWLKNFEKKKNEDLHIFSPRIHVMDESDSQKASEMRQNLEQSERRLVSIQVKIQNHLKEQEQYNLMLRELEELEAEKEKVPDAVASKSEENTKQEKDDSKNTIILKEDSSALQVAGQENRSLYESLAASIEKRIQGVFLEPEQTTVTCEKPEQEPKSIESSEKECSGEKELGDQLDQKFAESNVLVQQQNQHAAGSDSLRLEMDNETDIQATMHREDCIEKESKADMKGDALCDCAEELSNLRQGIRGQFEQLYRKTDICLATMQSNRNRCRKELKELRHMIKNFADEL